MDATHKDTKEMLASTINAVEVDYYEVDAQFPIAKMATIVQNLGFLTRKKSRGKTQK
jgi:hypothetical protein